MQSLISKLDSFNSDLIINIKDSYRYYGLCKTTTRGSENQIYEVKSKDQVVLDDSYNSFFYHKLRGTTFEILQERGKKRIYNANTTIDLVCFSTDPNFDEHIINRLSNIDTEVTIKGIDYDSTRIISEETGKKTFDFHKYLFVVNYQILYKTDNCYDACQ